MLDVKEWQNRPLDKSYPILFLDALRVNCRQDGRTVNKALYVALAINWDGKKEVLGLWLADTEGAKILGRCVDRNKKPWYRRYTDSLYGRTYRIS